MPDWAAYQEAEKRGILPPEKVALYEEAKKRGLIPEEFAAPERVGGTYQPKEPPFEDATSPISTITGKPEMEYVPGEEPGASFLTQVKASLVDDPALKIKRYAEARGLPVENYRLDQKGNIIFKNRAGKWQREIGETGISKFKEVLATATGHPGTYFGALGAALGPYGAVGGAATGELVRQAIGAYLYGGHKDPSKNLLNIGLETGFALLGEGAGKVLGSAINNIKRRGVIKTARGRRNPLTAFGSPDEAGLGVLTSQEHAQAALVKALAEKHGITLAPHQMYDRAGMRDVWAYLRKHPATADAIQQFEKNLSDQSEEAIDRFIRDLGGYETAPSATGEQVKGFAEKSIKELEDERAEAVRPIYERAFAEAEQAGGVDISGVIEQVDQAIKEYPEGPARKALQRIKKSLGEEKSEAVEPEAKDKPKKIFTPETDLRKIQKAIFDLNDLIEGTSQEASKIAPSSKKVLNRELEQVKKSLIDQIGRVSPSFLEANAQYEAMTNPVRKLKESVIGEITRIRSEKGLTTIPEKLFSSAAMPDAQLLRQAKESLEPHDPELWNRLVGEYIRNIYESAKATEQGAVKNIAGKMYKKLAGSKKQREIMRAALGPEKAQAFNDLMEVMRRASIGIGRESSETFMFQEINRNMTAGTGSRLYNMASQTRATLSRWVLGAWDEAIQRGKMVEYLNALTAPDAMKRIKKIKAMTPGSRKMIEALVVLTSGAIGNVEQPGMLPQYDIEKRSRSLPPQPRDRTGASPPPQ